MNKSSSRIVDIRERLVGVDSGGTSQFVSNWQLRTVATLKTPPEGRRSQVALRYGHANKGPAHGQPSRTRKT